MKNIKFLFVCVTITIITLQSCKNTNQPKETDDEDIVVIEETPIDEFAFIDYLPEETTAIPAVDNSNSLVEVTTVTTSNEENKTDKLKNTSHNKANNAKKSKIVTKHDTNEAHAFVNNNDDIVGLVLSSYSEQDTLSLHITETDTIMSKEKISKRRFKGIATVNNVDYSFDTPIKVTKSETGIDIDGNITLLPIKKTNVERDGLTTVSEETTSSDPIQVKVKQTFDKKTVIKLKDLKTGVKDKKVYDKYGNLLKEKKSKQTN